MAVEAVQILAPVLLLIGSLLLGSLPIFLGFRLNFRERFPKILSAVVLSTGGVLFAFIFIQVFPDVVQGVSSISSPFPLPETLTCVGFFILFLAEELFQSFCKYRQTRTASKEDSEESAPLTGSKSEDYGTSSSAPDVTPQSSGTTSYPVYYGGLYIILSLSLHYLLRAMTLGITANTSDTWYGYMAIAFQYYLMAFIIGVLLYSSNTHLIPGIACIIFFSLTSPLGAAIGFATSATVTDAASGILNGLINGGLLYVTFFGILQRHRYHDLPGVLQFLSVGVGFIIIVILRIALPPVL